MWKETNRNMQLLFLAMTHDVRMRNLMAHYDTKNEETLNTSMVKNIYPQVNTKYISLN